MGKNLASHILDKATPKQLKELQDADNQLVQDMDALRKVDKNLEKTKRWKRRKNRRK